LRRAALGGAASVVEQEFPRVERGLKTENWNSVIELEFPRVEQGPEHVL
jgi:hypothetical protein